MSIDNYRNFSILYVCCCTSSELAMRSSDLNRIGNAFEVGFRLELLAPDIGDKLISLPLEVELNEITLTDLLDFFLTQYD